MANLILNPSFEVDTDDNGLADNWAVTKTTSGAPTLSRVAGLFGSWAQRAAYTSSSDTAKSFSLLSDKSGAGSVAGDAVLTGGVWIRAVYTGVITLQMYIYCYNAADAALGTSVINFASPPSGVWWRVPAYYSVTPTNTSKVAIAVAAAAIDTGDSVTLDVDGVYLSADANFDHYGKYPVIGGVKR